MVSMSTLYVIKNRLNTFRLLTSQYLFGLEKANIYKVFTCSVLLLYIAMIPKKQGLA